MGFSKLTDMEMSDEDQFDGPAMVVGDKPKKPRYPWGLRIHLTGDDLKKMGIKELPDLGDFIDLRAFATVTSVSTSESDYDSGCRIEMQIEKLAVENEEDE